MLCWLTRSSCCMVLVRSTQQHLELSRPSYYRVRRPSDIMVNDFNLTLIWRIAHVLQPIETVANEESTYTYLWFWLIFCFTQSYVMKSDKSIQTETNIIQNSCTVKNEQWKAVKLALISLLYSAVVDTESRSVGGHSKY